MLRTLMENRQHERTDDESREKETIKNNQKLML